MDWFELQNFIAHLFEKLGYGKCRENLKVDDCGRDIILNSTAGLTVIECKHHPRGIVGRHLHLRVGSSFIGGAFLDWHTLFTLLKTERLSDRIA